MFKRQFFCVINKILLPCVFLSLFSCVPTPLAQPDVLYRRYKPVEGVNEVLDSAYLFSAEQLPLLVELDEYELSIMGIEIQNKASGGFSVSVTIEFKDEVRNLGFWQGRDPTAVYYSSENGCLLEVASFCQEECPGIDICGGYDCTHPELYSNGGISSNDCAGILMIEVDRWLEKPSRDERAMGIEEILFTKLIYLDELDYGYVSSEWNYAKVVVGLHREEKYPPMLE